jgi:hypothetical protein
MLYLVTSNALKTPIPLRKHSISTSKLYKTQTMTNSWSVSLYMDQMKKAISHHLRLNLVMRVRKNWTTWETVR